MRAKLQNLVKSLDMYGQDIGLNLKGESKFTTLLGGLCSIVTIFLTITVIGI